MTAVEVVVVVLLAFAVLSVSRRVRQLERGSRWIGDLRPGTVVHGPGGETWSVVAATLSAERGQTPSMRLDLIAGAIPKEP